MKKRLQVPTAGARRIVGASWSVLSATSQGEEIAHWNPDHESPPAALRAGCWGVRWRADGCEVSRESIVEQVQPRA